MVSETAAWAKSLTEISALPAGEQREQRKDFMDYIEGECYKVGGIDLPIQHALVDGLYIRTMHAPLGTTIAGRIHRKAGVSLLSEGTITIITEDGACTLTAPAVVMSKANSRRIGFAHTDVIWASIHATNNTDLLAIEDELYALDYEDEA